MTLERREIAMLRVLVVVCGIGLVTDLPGQETHDRFEFTRMVAHWAKYDSDDYLKFIEEAEPEVAQIGFYGAHFWSLVHTPQFAGYPAHFPVRGINECGKWFQERNQGLHARNVKAIGHFNVEFLVGEPDSDEGPRGFFKFYRDLWDEKQLGPKPVSDPMELLERGADGKPIINNSYSIGGMHEYWACLRNPGWQKVLKAWVKHAVDQGLDGLIANYFYRHNCLCEHCQAGFREHLLDHFTADQLKSQFQIADLANHKFDEIVFWHSPDESSPLRREMLRWSQISNKEVFDEVFVRYGRSLKPDLLVAQWNHLGNFGQINSDERCMLPAETWGRDEDYLWYSTGAAAHYSDLSKRYLGEGTLQARYIRGTFDDKPFTLGKYENTRIRVAISELAANGGAPMGFYTRYTDPAARQEIVRYYQFLKRYDEVYRANRSHAEVALLYPRTAVHEGNVEPVAAFRELGTKLLDDHVLFDVIPDDLITAEQRKRYQSVLTVGGAAKPELDASNRSRFDAPYTVRVSASRPVSGDEITLHLVNYNREEPPRDRNDRPSAGRGIVDEKPIAVDPVAADFVLPDGKSVQSVTAITPEGDAELPVKFHEADGRVVFKTPDFLVYCIVRISLTDR
ncbi:MAG: hypothetical protein CMJ64_30390 [Planctomycetaceae bacterium]|nr:hypothetical protein [Planctomycetaceae bacterium]